MCLSVRLNVRIDSENKPTLIQVEFKDHLRDTCLLHFRDTQLSEDPSRGTLIPYHVAQAIDAILDQEPSIHADQVLVRLLRCGGSGPVSSETFSWVLQVVNRQNVRVEMETLLEWISREAFSRDIHGTNQTHEGSPDQHLSVPYASLQGIQHFRFYTVHGIKTYVASRAYTQVQKPSVDVVNTPDFPSLADFLSYYKFASEEQILTVPVDPYLEKIHERFSSEKEFLQVCSAVIWVTPAQLYTIYILSTVGLLHIFTFDGKFKLYRASGPTR